MKDWSEHMHSLFECLSQVKQSVDNDSSITLEEITQQRIKDEMYKKKLLKSTLGNL